MSKIHDKLLLQIENMYNILQENNKFDSAIQIIALSSFILLKSLSM